MPQDRQAAVGGARGRGSRRLALLMSLLCGSVLLTACDSGSKSDDQGSTGLAAAGEGKPERTRVKFGILPTPDYAPVQIAIARGFFKEEGVEVSSEVIGPAGSVPALLGGSLDVAGVNWIQYLTATNENAPLSVVAEADRGVANYATIVVKADSPHREMADLHGKKVGVVATPGNCDVIPLGALNAAGKTARPQFVNIAIPDMPGNVERGGIDAACIPQPLLGAVMQTGKFRGVFDLFSGDYAGFPIVGFATSQQYAKSNPNTIGAIRRGLEKANALIRQDSNVVRQILPTYTSIKPEQAAVIVLPEYPEKTDLSKLKQVADLMERIGLGKDIKLPAEVSGN